jgi:hypothetical protein
MTVAATTGVPVTTSTTSDAPTTGTPTTGTVTTGAPAAAAPPTAAPVTAENVVPLAVHGLLWDIIKAKLLQLARWLWLAVRLSKPGEKRG